MPIGDRLRQLREARGMTRKELELHAGISENSVWRIEEGRVNPRRSTLERLATALGVTENALTGEEARLLNLRLLAERAAVLTTDDLLLLLSLARRLGRR